jgi:flotillin
VSRSLRTALASEKSTKCSCIRILCCRTKAETYRKRTLYTNANINNSCKIAKQKAIIDAQAEAEKTREATREKQMLFLQNGSRSKKVYMKSLTKSRRDTKKLLVQLADPIKHSIIVNRKKLPELVKPKLKVKISKLIKSPYGILVTMATTEGSTANFVSGMMKTYHL